MTLLCAESENDSVLPSCLDLHNTSVVNIFKYLTPNCNAGSWSVRDVGWFVAFYFHVVIFGILCLLIGIAALVFLSKRHLAQRFKARTFIAIDISLAILGFSKFLFYVIDPYGISGFCTHEVACTVISRLLFSLGFPSLTATYTLVFVTLWSSAKMRLGRACIQRWKIIVPLCFVHYLVAISFEFLGIFDGSYPVLIALIVCEAFFAVWGLFVCVTFLVAGIRLLKSVKTSARQSSVVSRDTLTRPQPEGNAKNGVFVRGQSQSIMRLKRKTHHKQAIRKVAIITYTAALLGAMFSLLGIAQTTMLCLQLFATECDIDGSIHQDSALWLSLKYIGAIIEVLLSVLLLYSINDIRPIVTLIKESLKTLIHCGRISDAETMPTKKRLSSLFSYEYSSEKASSSGATINSPSLSRKQKENGICLSPLATTTQTSGGTSPPSQSTDMASATPEHVISKDKPNLEDREEGERITNMNTDSRSVKFTENAPHITTSNEHNTSSDCIVNVNEN